ncbi:DNA repair protein RecN [Aliikangiella marina]|uniref:DNA repair protein RecN n=1 Tax=Aliikangiella marina TaxID=1712262 RepID=A0A545T101_9GAMM|nr:DNA repair protein RecN [Aliikangiella marina]TQV70893.1 DNA repair protein RecN [Aliikangiella marina]
MLSRIEIRNFAIIQSLDLDWSQGMTVITGETGAGKSIVIDALGLTLGERAEQSVIYPNAKHAEVTAIFDLHESDAATQWLIDNELEEDGECILRRVVVKEGRTKCFINGRSATQSQLKALGSLLVDIHGQHAHQTLLKPKEQLNLLDRYADHQRLLDNVRQAAQAIKQIEKRRTELTEAKQARDAKRELLAYQVEELTNANPEKSVLENLEAEHKKAATSQDRLVLAQTGMQWLSEDENGSVIASLARATEQISQLKALDPNLENIESILLQSEALLQEAKQDLAVYRDGLECDPEKLQQLDDQLATFHDLARKHHVSIEQLPEHFATLTDELQQLHADDSELEQIEADYQAAISSYLDKANKLTQSRQKTAKKLQGFVSEKIQGLAMEGGQLAIELTPIENQYPSSGLEQAEFVVSANPGQPLQPLSKVASGGELSRISLAIAVITAEQQLVPSIIFDEVDVGIGGGTAETVGILLRQLASQRQVICVTHQPQVASCGNHHLVASKTKLVDSTSTRVEKLDDNQRVEEIARMLGGLVISDKTRSHAREMLAQ